MNHAQLIALGRSLRVAGEHGQRLEDHGADADTQEIRQDLERALMLLSDAVSTSEPITRCSEHPGGPVDPDAADLCLLCETRRRTGARPPKPRSAGKEDNESPARVPSSYRIRQDQPQPSKRWIPEMWNGQSWQMCGTPRHSEQEAEQYVSRQYQEPEAASAYRLVYAFTDHDVVRVWGTPGPRRGDR
ncbi:hypothetical protein ABZX60_27885 [Streptomyces olivaceus]|uniref:hypothetical protein n=1 Tax=Streptomyces olivaceus TaxID=47716 RepID=UPI0033A37CE9